MKKKNLFSVLSLGLMALGGLLTLAQNWLDDKELDMLIDEKLNERLAAQTNEEESEES